MVDQEARTSQSGLYERSHAAHLTLSSPASTPYSWSWKCASDFLSSYLIPKTANRSTPIDDHNLLLDLSEYSGYSFILAIVVD